ncbi:MAG: ankyrin repeat domain-containing protein [Gemmatimonadaceae bacterium]
MSDPRPLPANPSPVQLRKQAKELLRTMRASNSTATLAEAQFALARDYGFPSWTKLMRHVESVSPERAARRPMVRPAELEPGRTWDLADGSRVDADVVWTMFVAAREGDVASAKGLIEKHPALALVEYNYTPPIHFAVREGHRDLVAFLLERGADPAYRSYPFNDALLMYAEERGHAEVAALLRERLARRFAIASNTEAIISAAKEGDLRKVNAELARDPSLARVGDEAGDTALHRAAHNGRLDVVRVLLEAGANAEAVRGDGFRPIHCALMPDWRAKVNASTRNAIVDLLLAHGAQDNIWVAAMRGDMTYVREALHRDSSLANFDDTHHHRPVSAAAGRGDLAMVALLLEHGADPSLPEEGAPQGHALWIAVDQRNRELVELLLRHGADPNCEVESSGTPYGHARERAPELREMLRAHGGRERNPEHPELQELFKKRDFVSLERKLRERPDILQSGSWDEGVLAGPARDADHEVIDVLLRVGARVPPVSKWGPFYYFKHERTAALLLQRGMDPNHMNWHRFTLLHHMAAEGELAKARLLLDHGADIDAIDEEYCSTPLGVAARRGQLGAVKLLLERGADVNASGAPWATPLRWARRRKHEEIVAALVAAGAGG